MNIFYFLPLKKQKYNKTDSKKTSKIQYLKSNNLNESLY